MNIKRTIVLIVALSPVGMCLAQSGQSRDSLAILKQALAVQRAITQAAEREANRLRYLLQANEASQKSLLVQDKELAALIGIQAYNFNTANGGSRFEHSVYEALLKASRNFEIKTSVANSTVTTNSKEMAEALCKKVTRNMTKEEWDYYFSGLTYERTCWRTPDNK